MTELVSIGRYIKFEKGKAPKETFDFPAEGLVPYLSPEYLRGIGNPMYVVPNDKLVNINDGEIIILWDGSNAGEILNSKKGILASTMTKIIFDENEFDKIFFRYVLKYNEYILKAKTAGSGIPHVDKGIVKKLEVLKPSKPEQKIIASVLIKVDDLIFRTRLSIEKAENLRKSLMKNLLTGKLKPDGTWRKKDEFFKDDKIGNVPVGWDLKPIGKCFEFFPTATYSRSELMSKGECKYIHYGDIHTKFNGFLDVQKSELPFISNEMARKYCNVVDGDLILADASEDYDGVGKSIEIKNIGDDYVISGLHTLHLRDRNDFFVNGYKGYMLHHWKVRNSIQKISTGIKVYSISKNDFKKILLPIPSKPEQTEIYQSINKIDSVIEPKQAKINKLERLKKSLLQNLLTGKVKIKN